MRKVRLVVATTVGGAPALLLAALLPAQATSCGGEVSVSGAGDTTGAAGGTSTAAPGGGGTGATTTTGSGGTGAADAGLDAGLCEPYEWEETFEVEIPPEGVPAEPGQLCAAVTTPVESNRAATVSLNRYSASLHLATGAVMVPDEILARVVDAPTIEVTSAQNPELLDMQVSNVLQTSTGYTFDAAWPTPFEVQPDEWARMTVRVSLRLSCASGPAQQVQSHTDVHLCAELDGPQWVSSGDVCTTCSQICEMAPSPTGPGDEADDLPLARPIRVVLQRLATVGRSQVLMAEHDGGAGLDYRWEASNGEIRRLAPDVVIWTRPSAPGAHLLSVAVRGSHGIGFASLAAA